jgi:hypothetical protein
MTNLYLDKLHKKYKVIYLHNPKHFFLNSLWIEDLPNGDKLLCAHARLTRNNRKNFTRLALLKKKVTPKEFINKNTQSLPKPYSGIFTDQ